MFYFVSNANVYTLFFIPFLVGIFKEKQNRRNKYFLHIFLYSIFALLLTTYITKAETLGRSFIGFFWLMLPFVFSGLAKCYNKLILSFATFSFLAGLACIVLDPSAPLWPAKIVASKINHPSLKAQLEDYTHYSKRQYGSKELLKYIPPESSKIGIIIESGYPFSELWLNNNEFGKVIPLGGNTTKKYLLENNIEYLIIINKRLKGQNRDVFLNQIGVKIITTSEYTTYMQNGPESWFLCKVKE